MIKETAKFIVSDDKYPLFFPKFMFIFVINCLILSDKFI